MNVKTSKIDRILGDLQPTAEAKSQADEIGDSNTLDTSVVRATCSAIIKDVFLKWTSSYIFVIY